MLESAEMSSFPSPMPPGGTRAAAVDSAVLSCFALPIALPITPFSAAVAAAAFASAEPAAALSLASVFFASSFPADLPLGFRRFGICSCLLHSLGSLLVLALSEKIARFLVTFDDGFLLKCLLLRLSFLLLGNCCLLHFLLLCLLLGLHFLLLFLFGNLLLGTLFLVLLLLLGLF